MASEDEEFFESEDDDECLEVYISSECMVL